MIFHVSKDFAKRFNCDVGGSGQPVLQTGRFDAWSAHCFKIGRKQAVIFMNDATLYSVMIPAAGLRNFELLFTQFIHRVSAKWNNLGAEFNTSNQAIILLPRSNKSLIGSMNDAIRCVTAKHEIVYNSDPDVDWNEYECGLNTTPYKALKYNWPEKLLRELLSSG